MNAADSTLWWHPDCEEGERHQYMIKRVRELEEEQYALRERDLKNGWLYDQRCRLIGADFELRQHPTYNQAPVIENVVRSAIDTLTSMIAKVRPRIEVLVDDQQFEIAHRAKLLERYIEAEFRRLRVYEDVARMFRDACVYGTGFLKVYEYEGAPAVDHVLLDEVIVDAEEARFYAPRSMWQRRFVDRWVLINQVNRSRKLKPADKKRIIETIETISDGSMKWCSYRRTRKHQVVVVEGWHLPSGPGAGDGRHVWAIDGADIIDETYEDDDFPIIPFRYSEASDYSYHGVGICEIAMGKQNRINRHNRFIATAQDRIAVPRVYFPKGAGMRSKMSNEVGLMVESGGPRPPTFETPQAVGQEIYNDRRELRTTLFEDVGVSQLQATQKKPVGIESAPALRELVDIGSERHADVATRLEGVHPEVAERLVRIARKAYMRQGEDKVDHKAVWNSRDLRKTIPWSKIDLDGDRYTMTLGTASMLTRTPAGQKQEALDRFSMGLWTAEQVNKVLGDPDVSGESELSLAPIRYADWVIEGLIEEDMPMARLSPDATIPELGKVIDRVGRKKTLLMTSNAPPEVVERFVQWIEQANFILNPPAPPAPPQMPMDAGAGGMPPEGMPPEGMPPEGGMPMAPPPAPGMDPASQPFIAAGAQVAAGM